MKAFTDIRSDKRIRICEANPAEGCWGFFQIGNSFLKFIASWGGQWDHVSVSREDRTPRWEEMAAIKDAFFLPEECAIQYHPPQSDYVNIHNYCLHIWRPQGDSFPVPPLEFV